MKPDSFGGKIFLAAPREMSAARFKEIIKHYLPKAPLIIGISKEPYVIGFENQPQFKMLKSENIQSIIDKVNAASKKTLIEVFEYSQSELAVILDTPFTPQPFKRVLLVNGSWKYTFQNHIAYRVLLHREIPFKYISPFVDEAEAKAYEAGHQVDMDLPSRESLSEKEMLLLAAESAKQSYDYSFQTGASLGRQEAGGYAFLLEAFNKVVPYQTYALLNGNAREKYATGVHDINHYDTIHAEMYLLIKALEQKINLKDTTLFINLLPCSTCARTLSQTDIAEIVYVNDHSDGYATKLLQDSGKTVRQVSYNRK